MEYNDKFGHQVDDFIYIYTKAFDFKQVIQFSERIQKCSV